MKGAIKIGKWMLYAVLTLALIPAVMLVGSQTHFPEEYREEVIDEVIPFPEEPVVQEQEEAVEVGEEVLLAQNTLMQDGGESQNSGEQATIEKSRVRLADASEPESAEQEEFPMAPDFTLLDTEGNEFTLSEKLGKLTILNFFATWCGPCKREIPDFVSLYDKYNEQGLEIIGVSVDRGRSISKVKPLCEQYKINYPVLMEGTSTGMLYGGVSSIPTTFIINERGQVLGRIMGARPHEFFEQLIQKEMLK